MNRLSVTSTMLFVIRTLRNEENAELAEQFEKILIDREIKDLELTQQIEDMDEEIRRICQT